MHDICYAELSPPPTATRNNIMLSNKINNYYNFLLKYLKLLTYIFTLGLTAMRIHCDDHATPTKVGTDFADHWQLLSR
jgi:hypothetical protein